MNQLNNLEEAARLLVDIAGSEPVHIEMSARGPRKYYDVQRALTECDARAHLAGYSTRGATLRHPQGMTRALCYDADTPGDWLRLVEAAISRCWKNRRSDAADICGSSTRRWSKQT